MTPARPACIRLAPLLGALACAMIAAALPAAAQVYPARPIKLVVPFGPGGPTDVAARVTQEILQGALGQSIVIENRPGAGGGTGTRSVAGADPDGYTLLIGTAATLGAVPALQRNPGFDPIKSFVAIAKLTDSTPVLVTPFDLPPRTLAEFIAYAKANPGKLNYSSAGVGNLTHLNAEIFKAKAGIDAVHVPYKSGAEMVMALLGGQAHMTFADISILLPLIEARKLKALAVPNAARHPALPDVPTMVESGLDDFISTFWTGLMAPAGTPDAIVGRLSTAIAAGLATASVRATLTNVGASASPLSPVEFTTFVAAEVVRWHATVKLAGLVPE